MTEYRVDQIQLTDSEAEQVADLVNASFPDNPDIVSSRIKQNTQTTGSGSSIYVAATIGSEIIGFNAFIAHKLWLNGERLSAFQSCWTATSAQHRGKRIFQNLINGGREIMKARHAAFMFGFPNANSYPIFVGNWASRDKRRSNGARRRYWRSARPGWITKRGSIARMRSCRTSGN